ncbi:EAL domain-containing protein [Aeromonas schubertii]|uniref:EAL domain-containing protein n=1 Tax=Aeromonas TaxID=642 RepID=UPI00067EB748|nr:EAL domain-containing protein [Aeromonas schubertii]KUE79306.1 diguanylate phosphodiesterase [Aeromonas schubertii]MBZ6071413.1 EAL domain-containing protein [Aeromonas schubertii]
MTLYRQLLATMVLLFGLLFLVSYWVQFNSTRSYLAQQQETTVINTATSLGLALTPYLETGDKVGAESVINAVFDGGYYRQVRLDLLASNSVIERENTTRIKGVPDWFIALDLFPEVSYESTLTSGWLQLGQLKIVGHPGQAYYELWGGMSELASWFLIGFLITVLLLMRALHYLLRPLQQICEEAVEIEQHHFGHTIPLPKTYELRQVVQAINTLASKLAMQFKEQADEAEMLRERVYKDAVSGLGNRAYFVGQINAWIAEGGMGGVLLVAVDVLDDIYRDEGYAARDNMVKSIAACLRELLQGRDDCAIARISATEYAVLYPTSDKEQLRSLAEQINERIADLVVNPNDESRAISVVGAVMREHDEDLSALLTKADNALSQARNARRGAIVMEGHGQGELMGRLAWRDLVQDAIRSHLLRFKAQPACRFDDQSVIHAELFASIHRDGTDYFAGQFMPAIEQFQMGAIFDRAVLESLAPLMVAQPTMSIAVNIMAGSLCSNDFAAWLKEFLASHPSLKGRLFFEIPEGAIMKHRDEVANFIMVVREQGYAWGVDHFGRHFQSLGYLETLQPSYVKVDHGYTSQVLEAGADTAFLSAVCRTAHNAGIMTIATRVENEEQVKALSRLHIDGYQGFVHPAQSI